MYRVYGLSPVFDLFTRILLNVKNEIQFEKHLHPQKDRGKKFILMASKNKIATPSSTSAYRIIALSWWQRIVHFFFFCINILKIKVVFQVVTSHFPLPVLTDKDWCSSPRPAPLWVQEARGCPSNEPIAAALRVPVARRSTNWRARLVAVRWGVGRREASHPPQTDVTCVGESRRRNGTAAVERCGCLDWMFLGPQTSEYSRTVVIFFVLFGKKGQVKGRHCGPRELV